MPQSQDQLQEDTHINTQAEICCGSYYDARQTEAGGARRIELNSVLHIGDSTPSVATLRLIKEHAKLGAMTMIRPHGTGFHYLSQNYDAVVEEARNIIKNGADEIVFDCLDTYRNIDTEQGGHIAALTEVNHKRMVLHHAFDCAKDPFRATETLINMGVDRMLTSGTYPVAFKGKETVRQLQEHYGNRIEVLAGYGIDTMNAKELMIYTGVKQIHSSCKDWLRGGTTCGERVTYDYESQGHKSNYEVTNSKKIEHLIWSVRQPSAE